MRTLLIAAASVVALSASAFAGEGNGEPFPPPDSGVISRVETPKYTMGATAPFNYFVPGTSTTLTHYVQAPGSSQDPYPYKTSGRVIQLQPTAPSTVAASPAANAGGRG